MVRILVSTPDNNLMALIPLSVRPLLGSGDAICLGNYDEDGLPKGALVASVDEQNVCRIESLFVLEEYRRRGFGTELIEGLKKVCVGENLTGIIAEWAEPGMEEFSDFYASIPFAKGKDGNTVFVVPLKEGADFVVPGEEKKAGVEPVQMKELSTMTRINWTSRFGVDIHPSLDPHNLDGRLLSNHSYFICDGDDVTGFLLATRLDDNTVSVAALHVDPEALKSLPHLLGTALRSLAKAFPEDDLRFTVASKEAMGITRKLLKKYPLEAKELRLKTACWNSMEWGW